jgi:hypothetical protein
MALEPITYAAIIGRSLGSCAWLAPLVGRNADHHLLFGPTNVAIQATSIELETGHRGRSSDR